MEQILAAAEVCEWLKITPDQLRQLRLLRDGTRFPPPLLAGDGLAWHEADVVEWLSFLADWRDAGATREALEQLDQPTYLAVEPEESRKEQTR